MSINLKRVYEPAESADGYRILVDRLWPRGISKDRLKIDEWLKEIAPSNRLRISYHAGELDWEKFRKEYLSELNRHKEELKSLAERSRNEQVTLVFSSKNIDHNNAVVLKQFLETL